MPRKARVDSPGALHHIIVRGIGLHRQEVSWRLGVSQPSVSISVKRGEKIVMPEKLMLAAV